MNDNFAHNLRLLTGYYKSVAEVCRRLDINRPQFNRYLSGRNRPSQHTLRRFCAFFGVEEHEILLPGPQFQRLVQTRPVIRQTDTDKAPEMPHVLRLQSIGTAGIERFLGYYFETYMSMAYPGKILRTLVVLERRGDAVYYQRSERIVDPTRPKVYHGLYLGTAHLLTDRIFMHDYETLTGQEMTQTILFLSFKNRVTRLTGLRVGVSGSGERMPSCARVVYEYLGVNVNLRGAFRRCGLFAIDDPEIDSLTRQSIVNTIEPGEWHLRARYQ